MTTDPMALLGRLEAWLSQWPSAVVSYSGGVDSALVLAAAHRRLGDRVVACLASSPSLPVRERHAAVELAGSLGAACRVVETDEHHDPHYAANPPNRCYFCKQHWFARMRELADREGWAVILDGTNADDLSDHRPGRAAAADFGVRSPLAELGLTKREVRQLARCLDLPVWDKPSMACLASRIPHGVGITPDLLHQIERAENALADLGFTQYRVRHHGETARIELPPADFPRAVDGREKITTALHAVGYRYVCLDLAGFRPASGVPSDSPHT